MGNFFSGLAQTAIRAAPFAAQVVAQREAKQKADLAAALAQMHQQSEDNTKNIAANVAAGVGIANIGHINAETDKIQKPTPKVMRGPGGQLVTYDEDNPTQASTFGPAPIPKAPTAEPLVPVMQHGKRVYVKRSEAAGLEAPEPAAPQQSFTPFQGTNPDNGQPVVRPFNTKTGQFGPVADVAPKPGAAAGGSASLSADDRAKMLSQAKLDNETMKAYETDVLAGKKHVGTAAGVAGATADAHGGVMNNVIGVLGNTATGALDADYQKYLTAQRSYGRIMGNLQSKRYTDHQAEIERSISGLQGNDLPGTIQYKQSLRDASLADALPSVASSPAARGRGGPPNVPHPQNRNDHPGPPNIGGGHSGDAEAAWAAKNPPHPGESFEAYHARFVSGGAP